MNIQKNEHIHQHSANKWSMILSFLCAIHCILTPVIVTLLPFAGQFMKRHNYIDLILISGVFVLGTSSILHGYKYHHHKKTPAYIFIGGLTLMITSALLEYLLGQSNNSLYFLSAAGGILSGTGQFYNFKLSR